MTAAEFRRLALSLPETAEGSHVGHPDFRVRGKIFATLGYPAQGWGTVMLTPAQQEGLVELDPDAHVPAKGAWGRAGATSLHLRRVAKDVARTALAAAWRNKAPKSLARTLEEL